jgi:phosphopantothenoylcysteine synthetase/decarboxylase
MPIRKSKSKIKKSKRGLIIKLKQTVDILKWAGRHKHERQATPVPSIVEGSHEPRIVVGFALEDRDIRANAEKKLIERNLDIVIANTPEQIASRYCRLQIKTSGDKWVALPKMSKEKAAPRVIRMLEGLQK